jgi:peptidoglycan/LPS O-acetylase OafA/YrhL
MVIVNHLFRDRLPGGYVGVDIFFVISGFLITAHLLREVQRTGRISLAQFWARRARRLLPASLLVLVVSAVGVLVVVPQNLWAQFTREIAAAAGYFLNWLLAADAVDYLAADNVPSPVQHYWSLSVEEQFYVVWPVLILLAALVAVRFRNGRSTTTVVAVLLAIVTVASFAASVAITATDASSAYFVTTTRAWEFGLGGLLAILAPRVLAGRDGLRASVSLAGVVAIVVAAFAFNDTTSFPGYAALLPVAGTLAVIWAGTPARVWSPTTLGALPPVQWLGDVSYSAYLWHWPFIVLLPYYTDYDLTLRQKLVIFAVTLVLAFASKKLVEDPVRDGTFLKSRAPRWTLVATVFGMIIALAIPAGVAIQGSVATRTTEAAISDALANEATTCFGAAFLDPDRTCAPTDTTSVVPDPTTVSDDKPAIYTGECRSQPTDPRVRSCEFGDPDATIRVALIGDSHSASWFPALDAVATQNGWSLTTYFKASCEFSNAAGDVGPGPSCEKWNVQLQKDLAKIDPYDYIFTAHRSTEVPLDAPTDATYTAAMKTFTDAWQPQIYRGTTIVAIKDVPLMTDDTPTCVVDNLPSTTACNLPQDETLAYRDPMYDAADGRPGVVRLDFSRYFCADDECLTVVGGVVVWRDSNHLTATYSTSLAPVLAGKLRDAAILG